MLCGKVLVQLSQQLDLFSRGTMRELLPPVKGVSSNNSMKQSCVKNGERI